MVWIAALGLLLWYGGGWLNWPRGLRLALLGVLALAVVLVQTTLPETHGLRAATGSLRAWSVVALSAALMAGYGVAVQRLRKRAKVPAAAAKPATPARFSEEELNRYARHIMLREIGGPGQKALKNARVLVIGAGGLGSPALLYLAAAGVGTIGVIDDDVVDASNLQRQVIHADARLGMPKVFSAEIAMKALNPHITVRPYKRRLDAETAAGLFADFDLILDGSDNFDTRYLANRVAVAAGKPLIAAAITQWEGQIALYDPARGGACYECVFAERPAPGLVPTCAEAGVMGALPGILGAMMAAEAIKAIAGAGETLRGRLMIYDALYADARVMRTAPRADCPACSGRGIAAG
ncbi:MAG: HesA/MoeB/ThiF family protein [Paracoccaceae bacterium]